MSLTSEMKKEFVYETLPKCFYTNLKCHCEKCSGKEEWRVLICRCDNRGKQFECFCGAYHCGCFSIHQKNDDIELKETPKFLLNPTDNEITFRVADVIAHDSFTI